ncbi:MAG TPA: hypothetical protein VFH61_06720 [Thermoleophilia bacterium]|nr:hypothetical protein [Thermoleophilia bacterium]
MADDIEDLRSSLKRLQRSNEELTETVDGLRDDLADFTEQVKVIAAAVQGMGGIQAVMGKLAPLIGLLGKRGQ